MAQPGAILPDPLDDWLGGIASDTSGITEKAVSSELNAIWRADVLPFCEAALTNRYPFSPDSAIDVNVKDFARLFGPGGLIDAFINDHLISLCRHDRPSPGPGAPTSASTPTRSRRSSRRGSIRDALFPGGPGPMMTFTLEPKDLSPNATRVTLNLDGQSLIYFNNATRPQPMTWPGKDGTGVITWPSSRSTARRRCMVSETGSWAWLRLLRSGRFTGTSLPDVYTPAPRRARISTPTSSCRRRASTTRTICRCSRGSHARSRSDPTGLLRQAADRRRLRDAAAVALDFVQPWDRWLAQAPRAADRHGEAGTSGRRCVSSADRPPSAPPSALSWRAGTASAGAFP